MKIDGVIYDDLQTILQLLFDKSVEYFSVMKAPSMNLDKLKSESSKCFYVNPNPEYNNNCCVIGNIMNMIEYDKILKEFSDDFKWESYNQDYKKLAPLDIEVYCLAKQKSELFDRLFNINKESILYKKNTNNFIIFINMLQSIQIIHDMESNWDIGEGFNSKGLSRLLDVANTAGLNKDLLNSKFSLEE